MGSFRTHFTWLFLSSNAPGRREETASCVERDRGRDGRRGHRFAGIATRGNSFPDFLFDMNAPTYTATGRGRKDFLVGDFKLTLRAPSGRSLRQLNAMARHARGWGALRATMVVALRGNSSAEHAIERAIVREGSLPFVETLF